MDALLDGKRAVCRKCSALDWECMHAATGSIGGACTRAADSRPYGEDGSACTRRRHAYALKIGWIRT